MHDGATEPACWFVSPLPADRITNDRSDRSSLPRRYDRNPATGCRPARPAVPTNRASECLPSSSRPSFWPACGATKCFALLRLRRSRSRLGDWEMALLARSLLTRLSTIDWAAAHSPPQCIPVNRTTESNSPVQSTARHEFERHPIDGTSKADFGKAALARCDES